MPARAVPEQVRRYARAVQMLEESIEFHRGRESVLFKPEDTTPPENEQINTHAVWAVELYTPLHAARMIEGLRALDVDTDQTGFGPPTESVRRGRSYPLGGSWVNLGLFVPHGSSAFFGRIPADLPSGVTAAVAYMWTITSSLSALIVQFVLTDELEASVDRTARRNDFEPKGELLRGGGVTVQPPENVKQAAIDEARKKLRRLPADWICKHAPGAFAARGLDAMPTAELVAAELGLPFAEETRRIEYMRFLGLGWDPLAWQSDELKGWRLAFDRGDRFMVVAGRRGDVRAAGQLEHRGSDEPWAMAMVANDYLQKDLVIWAASQHLVQCQERLSEIRDAGKGLVSGWFPTVRLKRIGEEFLRESLDARTAAAELKRFSASDRDFRREAAEWKGVGQFGDRDLLGSFREAIRANAGALLSSEERLRDSLLVETTMVSTIANLRVQRWLLIVTVLAAIAASVSLYLTLSSG